MARGSGRNGRRAAGAVCALAALLALTACSTGSGSSKLTLGLSGSTVDHPGPPPTLAASGPTDAYAFVYDDQIWIHDKGQPTARQLTHLVLSAGAAIAWGPLVWSPNGQFIAVALSESLTPTAAARSTGPIYVVSMGDGSVVNTAATGSLYGHTYAWFGNTMLFYSDSGGIFMYDVGDGDPRVWSVLTPFGDATGLENRTVSGGGVIYGDLELTSKYLYYTKIMLDPSANLGAIGVVGTAALRSIPLHGSQGDLQPNAGYQPGDYLGFFPLTRNYYNTPNSVQDLGNAYFDAGGDLIAGAWQINGDASRFVAQSIGGVNAKDGTVSSSFSSCSRSQYYPYGYGCNGILPGVGSFLLTDRPELGLDPRGVRVAFTAGTLHTQATSGGAVGKLEGVGWIKPLAWSNDGKLVAATQFVSAAVDANDVTQVKTNIVIFDGTHSLTLVPGGQDLAWAP
jgi:hypothetical protein